MLLKINPGYPERHKIEKAVDCLRNGGIIIYPTDSIYTLGCDLYNTKAIQKIGMIKGVNPEKTHFSIICSDISQVSEFTQQFDTPTFKLLKRSLPGPFTFIMPANKEVPRIFKFKKNTIGVRVPDNAIANALVMSLGNPIISTSVYHDDTILEYMTDPEMIYEKYYKLVDIVIDGGAGDNNPSTIVDLTNSVPAIIRQGKGELV